MYLGALDPSSRRVELYAKPQNGAPAFRQEMHPRPRQSVRGALVCDTNAGRQPALRSIPRRASCHTMSWHYRRKSDGSCGKDERPLGSMTSPFAGELIMSSASQRNPRCLVPVDETCVARPPEARVCTRYDVYIPRASSRMPFAASRRKSIVPAWSTVVTSRKNT